MICSVENCGRPYLARNYCNRHYKHFKKRGAFEGLTRFQPVAERFMRNVEKDPDGCWLWTASKFVHGYGQFKIREGRCKNYKAHRWAYEHFVGPIPEGLVINHLCEVKACVNPEHLEPCTSLENALYSRSNLCGRGHEKVYRARRCQECANLRKRERRAEKRLKVKEVQPSH